MNNPIMFEIGKYQIHWYSVLILIGAIVGYWFLHREAKKKNVNTSFIGNLFFWTMIFGIIGARGYYVFFNWNDYYSTHVSEIFQIWNGGLAIHGGIILGLIFIILYCIKYKVRVLRITDFGVVGLTIAQVIGRWGNFFNSEAYGPETTRKALEGYHLPEFVIEGMKINGTYYHPTFFYESLWMFIGFVLLLIIRRLKYTKIGQITGIYMMWYGVGRFFIESLRQDSLWLGDFRIAQIISVVLFVVGLIIFAVSGKGSKFENLYGEKDEEEIKF